MKKRLLTQTIKIKDLGKVITGTTPPTANKAYFGGQYLFIKPSDIYEDQRYIFETEMTLSDLGYEYQSIKALPKNSICVVCIGTIGKKMCLTSQTCFTNQQLNSIIVNNSKYDSLYIYYLIRYYLPHLKQLNAGSTSGRENVNKSSFENIEIQVHELKTQQKIAAILSNYDDLIENNTRRIKILEEMVQTLYHEWFVKFRFPGHEQVKMVESELGLIPEGWEVKKLGDVVELAYGKALKAGDRLGGEVAVYGSSGVVGYHNKFLVKAPGIIVGRKGNVGSVFWSDKDFYPIDTVYYVQTQVSLYYVYYNLKTQNFINNDAAVPGLNRNQAYSLPFILPSMKLLDKFQNFVQPIFQHLNNLKIKISNKPVTYSYPNSSQEK